jgi:ABC-type uncharacterized transport system ATPase component
LFVTGSDKIATSALLLTLSGRLDPDAGKIKVADMVLPVRSGAVRSRVALIDVAEHANRNTVAAIDDAASEKPQVIILDNIDFLSSESERYAVADALNARSLFLWELRMTCPWRHGAISSAPAWSQWSSTSTMCRPQARKCRHNHGHTHHTTV